MHIPPASRYNIYGAIHKALRAFMADTLVRSGRTDWEDADDRDEALAQVCALMEICQSHLEHENAFVHVAMEARAPGSAAHTAHGHEDHEAVIAGFLAAVEAIDAAPAGQRAVLGEHLYHRLAAFVAENLEHMAYEETQNNAVLWTHYSDAEIHAIEDALRVSLPPASMGAVMRWMLPAVTPAERAGMLLGMRANAPEEVFAGVMQMLEGLLSPRDLAKLRRALEAAHAPVALAA